MEADVGVAEARRQWGDLLEMDADLLDLGAVLGLPEDVDEVPAGRVREAAADRERVLDQLLDAQVPRLPPAGERFLEDGAPGWSSTLSISGPW